MGGMSGSMTSQLMKNIENGDFIENDIDEAICNGVIGGGMVGAINLCFPSPLTTNTMQILRDGIKDEAVNAARIKIFKEKRNEWNKRNS